MEGVIYLHIQLQYLVAETCICTGKSRKAKNPAVTPFLMAAPHYCAWKGASLAKWSGAFSVISHFDGVIMLLLRSLGGLQYCNEIMY